MNFTTIPQNIHTQRERTGHRMYGSEGENRVGASLGASQAKEDKLNSAAQQPRDAPAAKATRSQGLTPL
jgi:hypothetical protein